MKQLRGTNAIVTGASRGIGVHIARALAKEGVNLALAARSVDDLENVCAEMRGLGVKAVAIECDVARADHRARLVTSAEEQLGPIDILVNNAGVERVARFDTTPEDWFTETLEINLHAPIQLTRAIVPGMLARGRGHVVNIASGAGKVGVAYGTAYCASKHGLVGFTNALRGEYHGKPVGFSVVCPAFVTDTGMYDRWEKGGIKAPKIAGSCKPEKVASVVVDCITKDRAEVLVNTPPIRPLVVLANIAPGIVPAIMKRVGYSRVFERAADAGIH